MPENTNKDKFSNYSLNFDGSSNFININSLASTLGSKGSFSAWVNVADWSSRVAILGFAFDADNFLRFGVRPNNNNCVSIGGQFNNVSHEVLSNTTSLYENVWYHVVATSDGSFYKLYINGQLQTLTILAGSNNGNWVSDFSSTANKGSIGSLNRTGPSEDLFNGKMDQVCVFDYELSTDQITYLYNLNNPMAITGAKPVAYWPLGDNSNPSRQEGYPNLSVGGSVFDFDGTDDFIDLVTTTAYDTGDLSTAIWVKITDNGTTQFVFANSGSSSIKGFAIKVRQNNEFGVQRFNSTNGASSGWISPGFVYDTWQHLAFTYEESTGTIKTFLNGNLVATDTGTSTAALVSEKLTIGSYKGTQAYANGELSNAVVFNSKLEDSEITTLYNNGVPGDISSLNPNAWYKLDSSEIFNSTSTEWSVDNNAYPSVYKSSLNFNGSSNYIDCGSASYLNGLSQFSVSCWFNLNTAASNKTIASDWFYNSGVKGHFALQSTSAADSDYGLLFLVKKSNDVGQNYVTTGRILTQNTWNHAVFAYNSGTVTCYINGQGPVSLSTTGTLPTTLTSQNGNLNIGKFGGSLTRLWDGEISQVSIFNTELTSSEVTTIYNNGTPEASISHSPVSWYKLDNTTTGIQDSAGSNNGTNNGATEYAGFVNALAGESVNMSSANLVQSDLYRTTPYSNYSINFDSPSGDYFNFNNASSNIMANKNTISISAWFKLDSNTTSSVVSNWYGGGLSQYLIRYNTGANLGIQWYVKIGSTAHRIDSNYYPSVGDWVHVVVVKDPITNGGQIRLYINNSHQYTLDDTNISNPIFSNNGSDQIGVFNNASNFMDGSISNVAYWTNTALTQVEATEIYNAGVTTNLSNFSGTAPDHWCTLDGKKVYYNGSVIVARDAIGTLQATGVNLVQENIVGNAPGSNSNGTGSNLDISDLKGDMINSTKNAKSINMADYGDPNAQGVTPANSGRTTSVPG